MAHLFRDCASSKQVLEGIGVKLLAVNMQQNWKQWLKEEENVVDSTMAEARACLKAVSFAEELVFQNVCVEGDALTIIRKLQSGEEDRSSFSTIISAIKGRNTRFRTLEFRFVPREENEATHVMEVEGRKHDHAMNWIEEVSREVERIVVVTPQTRPKGIYHTVNQRGAENR
ncbi:uncharacterized protein LOC105767330 [Gossypium raimondii]|uniref:uncharacterized protein LOC105767330 n=1 Tax=Gossypium raimondii TaxID=29730 RepID=UPI00063AADDB|nr:uncharacterized protein LOC105767330 [Gossypium raimondii]